MSESEMELAFFPNPGEGKPQDPQCDCNFEKSQEVTFGPCQDVIDTTINNVVLKCEGRLLRVDVSLDKVCRGRTINIGILVTENVGGVSCARGFRACQVRVPGTPGQCADKVRVGEFSFVFPDENMCRQRKFSVKVIAHYVDVPDCRSESN